jgi:hypothetical protein
MIVPAAGHSSEQRRRYPFAAGLSPPPQHSAHGEIQRTVANAFQRLLEKLGGGDPDTLWQPASETVTA